MVVVITGQERKATTRYELDSKIHEVTKTI